MKFTKLNTVPKKTTFAKLKDGEFFVLADTGKDVRLYRKADTIIKDGFTDNPPVHKVPFGASLSPDMEGYTRSVGYQFSPNIEVFKVEIEEIIYRIV